MTDARLRDRARGALLGLAAGDAVGTTVEFAAPGSFAPLTDMVGGGPFGLAAGQWTDDTSMALCLADSLVACAGEHDPRDQLERYVRWYREGERSSTGRCFDIGNATRAALERFEATGDVEAGLRDPQAAGNGSLMRLAPVPIAFLADRERAERVAAEQSRTTHGGPQAHDACRAYAGLLVDALAGTPADELLRHRTPEPGLHPEVERVVAGSYLDAEPPTIRGGGYVVLALEAALWAVAGAATFADAVLRAANLGDDADTTAAIAGQLAGALHGEAGIPAAWRARLHEGDTIAALADALLKSRAD